MATILIADDHPFTLLGIKSFLEKNNHIVFDICGNGIVAYNTIASRKPDIAILDISMPGMNGIEILEELHLNNVSTKVVLLTIHKEQSIYYRAIELGAKGYILKEHAMSELEQCIREILRGKNWISPSLQKELTVDEKLYSKNKGYSNLSKTEIKILAEIAKKKTTRQIAEEFFISEKTIETHRRNIINKLDLPHEKNSLLLWAIQNMA